MALEISFTSLGLAVLDELQFPNRQPLTDILGGSGAYATLGARLFLPRPSSSRVGWMLHIGNDFPESIQTDLERWNTTLIVDREPDKPSTRGLLVYKDTTFGPKEFKYTTPTLSIEDAHLANTALLHSKAFHLLETPQNILPRVSSLLALRRRAGVPHRPLLIWEPSPPACKPEALQLCRDAAPVVDVLSPNHLELLALCGESPPATDADIDRAQIERLAWMFLQDGVGPDRTGTVVVRAGEAGCLVSSRRMSPTWLPPFYGPNSANVVDATGAGNAFLGAYAVGYLRTGRAIDAACYGSVGASFAVEQVGLPERNDDDDEGERWNGVSVQSRFREYTAKTRQ
ncbi:Ribokinase-like protein [Aspergillus ambiguus]|uniref:pfkB family carbohydrate kinase superfamily n=1 Tax=Aspergillus ambiguus TaxID=176160 RepID=UPI003CCE2A58